MGFLKRKLFKIFHKTNDIYYYFSVNFLYYKIHSLLENFHSKRFSEMIDKSKNFKSLYMHIKQNSISDKNYIFKIDNKTIDSNDLICEAFSDNFAKRFANYSEPNYHSNSIRNSQNLSDFQISKTDVLREIKSFDINKSSINSDIPSVLIKKCPEIFCEIFFILFNKMIITNTIPEQLKIVTVIPIYKKDKPKESIDSYRPITIEKNVLKLFTKLIFNNISAFVHKNTIIPINQYGFRPGMSTQNQLIDLIQYITDSFNNEKIICFDIVFIDLKNAFGSLGFGSILEKCYSIGITNNCLKILEKYLLGRKQIVMFENILSTPQIITSGVPEGGVGSPEIFNITVSDFPNFIQFSKLMQFADDSCLSKPIYNTNDIQNFQIDLNNVYNYCSKLNLEINSQKSIHLRISFKNCEHLNTYTINNISIPSHNSHKHLGVIIDNKLSFNEYTEYIYNKCIKKWHFLKRLCPYASSEVMLKLYHTYILPIAEYGMKSFVLNLTQTKKLESIQRKIFKQICYKMKIFNYNYNQRLKLLNITSLECRRNVSILKTVFKCLNNFGNVSNHWKSHYIIANNDRNGIHIIKPKTRNIFCDKNFFVHSINLFNDLPKDVRNETNINKFLSECEIYFSNH